MDRRGFLKLAGIGGALVAAAPRLLIPPARNVVAEPERTIFLPPAKGWTSTTELLNKAFAEHGGWLTQEWSYGRNPLADLRVSAAGINADAWFQPQWTLTVERPWELSADANEGFYPVVPAVIGGVEGHLLTRSIDIHPDEVVTATERYVGMGTPPDMNALGNVRARIKVEYASDPLVSLRSLR